MPAGIQVGVRSAEIGDTILGARPTHHGVRAVPDGVFARRPVDRAPARRVAFPRDHGCASRAIVTTADRSILTRKRARAEPGGKPRGLTGACSGGTLGATLSSDLRSSLRRLFLAVRVAILVLALLWGVASTIQGVRQQGEDLPPDAMDCSYRVELLRDRVVAVMDQLHLQDPDGTRDSLTHLLRETRAACAAKDQRLAQRLEQIRARYDLYLASVDRVAAARQELLAHE